MTEFFDDGGSIGPVERDDERLRRELEWAIASGRLPVWTHVDEIDADFAEQPSPATDGGLFWRPDGRAPGDPVDDSAEVAEVVRRRRAGELAGTRVTGNENPYLNVMSIARKAWMHRVDAHRSGESLSTADAVAKEIRFATAVESYRQKRASLAVPVSVEEAAGHVFQLERIAKLTGLSPEEIEASPAVEKVAHAFAEQARAKGRIVSPAGAVVHVARLLSRLNTKKRPADFAEPRALDAADIAALARSYIEGHRKCGVVVSSAEAVEAVLRGRGRR